MKENIEEYMEILEKNVKSVKENSDMGFFETDEDYYFFKAVEYILSDYKRVLKENEELLEIRISVGAHNRIIELEKENEELKADNKRLTDAYMIQKHLINKDFLFDYIPKQKIKDKIEEYLEYDKKYKTYTKDGKENFTMEYFKAKALQELLESEDK